MATQANVVYVARGLSGSGSSSPKASVATIGTNSQFYGERCTDGGITSIAIDGDRLYIAGEFTHIDNPLDSRVQFGRDRLAAFHIDSGMSLTDWNPGADDLVLTLSAACGVVYAGGIFSTVANTTRNRVAAIDAAGNLLPWSPSLLPLEFINVTALAVANSAVYIGGYFESVNGVARQHLAALDLEGQLLAWNPTLADDRTGGLIEAILISGDTIYVARPTFDPLFEVPTRLQAIGIDGTIENWSPETNGRVSALGFTQGRIVIGGAFHVVGGEVTGPIAVLER